MTAKARNSFVPRLGGRGRVGDGRGNLSVDEAATMDILCVADGLARDVAICLAWRNVTHLGSPSEKHGPA